MSQKVRLLRAFTPELDGVGKRMYRLSVTADEAAAKVDMLEIVFFGLQVCDLTDVVSEINMSARYFFVSE